MRIVLFLSLLSLLACQPSSSHEIRTLPQPGGGYGFQIWQGGKLIIDQPHIPAISGKKTFPSPQAASQAARLMISKMEKGTFPPSLTEEELGQLME